MEMTYVSQFERYQGMVDKSVYEARDLWKQQAQDAWQEIAELRQALVNLLPYASMSVGPHSNVIAQADELLKRTKP